MFELFFAIAYLAIFGAVAIAEWIFVERPAASPDGRFVTNFGLGIVSNTILWALPVGLVAAAGFAHGRRIGLFNQIAAPPWVALAGSLICLSLLQYVAHRLLHSVPPLWRLHRIHHADRKMDASTTLRTHPIEHLVMLSLLCPTIIALGTPVWAVFVLGCLSFAGAVFSHGNIRIAPLWSRRIVRLFATPDFHIIHHSAVRAEHDSNYGDVFTLWDRLFGTYRDGQVARLGLGEAADREADSLIAQLRGPFARAQSAAPAAGKHTVA